MLIFAFLSAPSCPLLLVELVAFGGPMDEVQLAAVDVDVDVDVDVLNCRLC